MEIRLKQVILMQHSFPHTPRKNRVGERGKASKREKGRREEDVFQGRKK